MIEFFTGSEKGPDRYHNEDRYWVSADRRLCAVLDGCGGRGIVADLVVESLARQFGSAESEIGFESLLVAVQHANTEVVEQMRTRSEGRGSGTTLDLLAFVGSELVGIHVGDGRVYLLKPAVAIEKILARAAASHDSGTIVVAAVY